MGTDWTKVLGLEIYIRAKLLVLSDMLCPSLTDNCSYCLGGIEKLAHGNRLPKAYSTGFIGCIKDVVIDRQELQLVEDALNNPTILHCPAKKWTGSAYCCNYFLFLYTFIAFYIENVFVAVYQANLTSKPNDLNVLGYNYTVHSSVVLEPVIFGAGVTYCLHWIILLHTLVVQLFLMVTGS